MPSLIAEFGSAEGEILAVDEINATDKFTNAGYLVSEGIPLDAAITQTWGCREGTPEHRTMKQKFLPSQGDEEVEEEEVIPDFRTQFPETMDAASGKAINQALTEGVSREDIIADLFGCKGAQTELGEAYFDYLQKRFAIVIKAKNHD
ncbi:hypothetical protein [Microseira wollei]|nr:hypothetical protein [Microseira wollei]